MYILIRNIHTHTYVENEMHTLIFSKLPNQTEGSALVAFLLGSYFRVAIYNPKKSGLRRYERGLS